MLSAVALALLLKRMDLVEEINNKENSISPTSIYWAPTMCYITDLGIKTCMVSSCHGIPSDEGRGCYGMGYVKESVQSEWAANWSRRSHSVKSRGDAAELQAAVVLSDIIWHAGML